MIDLNHGSGAAPTRAADQVPAQIVAAIDAALESKDRASPKRKYLGASMLGGPCARAIQYQYMQTPKDPDREFKGKILRIFQRGHTGEDMMAGWLRQAGFTLLTEGPDRRQFGFQDAGGRIKGHIDGVITKAPEGVGVRCPALWENKAMGSKAWRDIVSKGIKESKPLYYSQCQLYMGYMNLMENPCVFTVLNADTMEIHVELIPFDIVEMQRVIDTAVAVLKAVDNNEMLPRAYRSPDSFGCKWCDYINRCHEISTEAPVAPGWMKMEGLG